MSFLPLKNPVRISINGEKRSVPEETSVADLLQRLSLIGRRVAVAVNHDIVPTSQFAERTLADGDHVEILEAVGGG